MLLAAVAEAAGSLLLPALLNHQSLIRSPGLGNLAHVPGSPASKRTKKWAVQQPFSFLVMGRVLKIPVVRNFPLGTKSPRCSCRTHLIHLALHLPPSTFPVSTCVLVFSIVCLFISFFWNSLCRPGWSPLTFSPKGWN